MRATIVVLVLATMPACNQVPVNTTSDPTANFALVSTGIYRGARPDQAGLQQLHDMGVRTILDLENDDEPIPVERGWAEALGMTFVSQPMSGLATPHDDQINQILALMADPASRPIFVHCSKGQDRTGVVVALYRVLYEGWPPADAHFEMMEHGFSSILHSLHEYFEDRTGFQN